jgi:carbonic anhydrase
MSIIDDVLKANETYARNFKLGNLPMPPGKKLAVLACMDARLTIEPMLGLNTGDVHIIRNAGGIATEDAIRSLLISHYLLGTHEFMVINHTDCGMLTFKDADLLERLERERGVSAVSPSHFHAFENLEGNVRRQVARIKAHPWIPKEISVRGFVFDVKTGSLSEIRS